MRATVYHIPICPFCQRLEVLLTLKGIPDAVAFEVVDITVPRDPRILKLSGGSTALPVMDVGDGRALKESLVLMEYLEARYPERPVRRADPYERAVEGLLVSMADGLVGAGYRLVMNQDQDARPALVAKYVSILAEVDAFLRARSAGEGPWLFDAFGWAEAAYTPFFQRFAFLEYYEGITVPDGEAFDRVREWWKACVADPHAQQTSDEEVIKLYYDYAKGAGNGALLDGRTKSSFVLTPGWRDRPWPPKDKYGQSATDAELGLV